MSDGIPNVLRTIALSGGSTPRPAYERLAAEPAVPWAAVEIYFGDERAVPPTDPASNYRMAREALLDRVGVSRERVHRMEAGDPECTAVTDPARENAPRVRQVVAVVPDRARDLEIVVGLRSPEAIRDGAHPKARADHTPSLGMRTAMRALCR